MTYYAGDWCKIFNAREVSFGDSKIRSAITGNRHGRTE